MMNDIQLFKVFDNFLESVVQTVQKKGMVMQKLILFHILQYSKIVPLYGLAVIYAMHAHTASKYVLTCS